MRHQSTKVQSTITLGSFLEGLLDYFILGKFFFLDGLVNADNILPNDTSCANVKMTDLRIAH